MLAGVSFAGRPPTDADTKLDTLRAEYGEFEVREHTVEVSRELLADTTSVAAKNALGGARAIIHHDDAVLLVRDSATSPWDAPGGDRDPGEAHAMTAQRGVHEMTGLECSMTGIHLVHHYEFTLVEGTKGITGFWVVFEAETSDPAIQASAGLSDVAWFESPPDEIADDIRGLLQDHSNTTGR